MKLKVFIIFLVIFNVSATSDQLVINGLSKHFNTDLDRNSYNYGLGYIKDNHEIGFYRNSRKYFNSFSVYYSWNKELKKIGNVALGYRLGGALYDSVAHYELFLKPIIAGYADIDITQDLVVRVSGTYNLISVQLVYNID